MRKHLLDPYTNIQIKNVFFFLQCFSHTFSQAWFSNVIQICPALTCQKKEGEGHKGGGVGGGLGPARCLETIVSVKSLGDFSPGGALQILPEGNDARPHPRPDSPLQ